MSDSWFQVDRTGLARLLENKGKGYVLLELLQNAYDEKTTEVHVSLEPVPKRRGLAHLVVTDDSPDGFADLSHAFTLFAPSVKVSDAEKRGRFNLGEKLVLAICETAEIRSTTGGYAFNAAGRQRIKEKRVVGSSFTATIRMNQAEIDEALKLVQSIIPPAGVKTVINGEVLDHRTPLHTFRAQLPTEVAGEDGNLGRTARVTDIAVYEPRDGERAFIYEMGIPVVENGDRWSVDVGQKVPLNMNRDNVTPAYLRHLRTLVLNQMHERLSGEEATSTWVKEALSDDRVDAPAVTSMVHKLFGKDAVIYDPSDPEANRIAAAAGRTVIPPRAFSKEAWSNVRASGAVRPAGQVTPSPKLLTGPDGVPPIPHDQWTPGMERVAAYTKRMSKALLGFEGKVEFTTVGSMTGGGCAAAFYGGGTLTYNSRSLGKRFFDEPRQLELDALIIHELGHHYESNHLSAGYYSVLCDLGAKAKAKAGEIGTV